MAGETTVRCAEYSHSLGSLGVLEPFVDAGQHKECFVLVVDRGFESMDAYIAGNNTVPDPPEKVNEDLQWCISKLLSIGFAYAHLNVRISPRHIVCECSQRDQVMWLMFVCLFVCIFPLPPPPLPWAESFLLSLQGWMETGEQ